MVELFESYWWLMFPLIFFVVMPAWNSFMRYKQTKVKIDLLKTYAASGKEPPADLIASLDKENSRLEWRQMDGASSSHRDGRGGRVFVIILFAGLSAVFAFTGYSDLLGVSHEAFYFIALILGVLSLAFLVSAFFRRRPSDD
jgi:amino acid transporter